MTLDRATYEELGAVTARYALIRFLRESLMIEGILREPTSEEIAATTKFLKRRRLTLDAVCKL